MTNEQQAQICGIISLGGDHETAAATVGLTLDELRQALEADPTLAARVRRAESMVEVLHLQYLRAAAQDPRNWRVSVWLLERCVPHRYAPRRAEAITPRQLNEYLQRLARVIDQEVTSPEDRARLRARLTRLAAEGPAAGAESPGAGNRAEQEPS